MYRQYEDPYKLESQLKEAKNEYTIAIASHADEDILTSLSMKIAELEDRVNFAWQDDESEAK